MCKTPGCIFIWHRPRFMPGNQDIPFALDIRDTIREMQKSTTKIMKSSLVDS